MFMPSNDMVEQGGTMAGSGTENNPDPEDEPSWITLETTKGNSAARCG